MSDWLQVTTQAEFQAALDAGNSRIELTKSITVDIRVPEKLVAAIKLAAGALARVFSGRVVATGSSHVEAWGSSHVEAWESSHVEARESSHVVAWESSHVEARESSHVEAWGSSHVEAWGSSHVVAWESSSLALFGGSLTASATAQVAVQLHRGAKCKGGTQIKITLPKTAREWCDYYGAKIEGTNAIVFKGLDADFRSGYGAVYTPGTETVAPDWDGGIRECGGGLHFSPHPAMTKEFASGAVKFVACLVSLTALKVHPDGSMPQKVKAEKCWNYFECDSMGNVIGEKFAKPKAAAESAKKKPAKETK